MRKPKQTAIDCLISEAAGRHFQARGGKISTNELKCCGPLKPLRELLVSALDFDGNDECEIDQASLRAAYECIRLHAENSRPSKKMRDAVNATLQVISDRLQAIDLEVRMLNLRKKALKRRSAILQRLAEALARCDQEAENT